MNRTIATIQKNTREVLKIELTNFKGYNLIVLRLWIEASDGSGLMPTRKGINVAIHLLPAIREALANAEAAALAAGILCDESVAP